MSGFEIAGVVLGAFPIAIMALEQYREVARRIGFWTEMREEHQRCKNDLKFYRLIFTRNLRELILPLVADDDNVRLLLSDPGGEHWRDKELALLLEKRLGESYELYMEYMKGIETTVHKLGHDLALDSQIVQDILKAPKAARSTRSARSTMSQQARDYYSYKLKFVNGESSRNRHFDQLKTYNNKLEKLLHSSDKDTHTLQQRASVAASATADQAICSFWKHANQLFNALKSAWDCCCREKYCVQVLLQHRTTKKSEFHIMFARESSGSSWLMQETRIVDGNDSEIVPARVSALQGKSAAIKQPGNHRQAIAIKSAFRIKGQKTNNTTASRSAGSVTMTTTMEPVVAGQTSGLLAITDLCKSLNEGTDACYGYLTPEKDCKYFVYRVSTRNAETITLENILSGYVRPRPSRRQRYALASILASSFLQFIDTPLLPVTWKKSDIVFLEDINDPNVFALDRPQLLQNLTTIDKGKGRSGPSSAYSNALDMLGIVLLELCFGSLLENQPCRKSWPTGNDDKERQAFELMAAREWQTDVIGEAGPDYAGSVAWCLGGNRSSSADQWRNLMLQNVVNPLKRCHTYLAESEASISLAVNSAK